MSKISETARVLAARNAPRFTRQAIAYFLSCLLLVQSAAPLALARAGASNTRRSVNAAPAGSSPHLAAAAPAPQTGTQTASDFGIVLTPITTAFAGHVGVEHHQPTNKLLVTSNHPTGQPHNFELVESDGAHRVFSNIGGLGGELRVATARDDGQGQSLGGFQPGELFTGTGAPGVIARVKADGASVQNPWVTLPGETGQLNGGLHVDRTGVFAGDLIAVTTEGGVWRINAAGVASRVASLGTRLAGVATVPDDAALYGPWAGKILAGAAGQGLIYAVDAQGTATSYNLGLSPRDLRLIPAHENFYGVDPVGQKLWGAPAAAFSSMIGDLLVAQNEGGALMRVRWNGSEFEASEIGQAASWGQITFSPAGVSEIPAVRQTRQAIAVVRRAPQLDSGRVEGALWQLTGEPVTLDGTDAITSDLLVPGTPTVNVHGTGSKFSFAGTVQGNESAQPAGYAVTLTGNATLRHLITRTNPVVLAPVPQPPAATGTRDVSLSQANQPIGDLSTLRHLNLSGTVGAVTIPPGTYGRFSLSGRRASLVLGVENSQSPSVYNLESLALSGGSELRVLGNVVLNVRDGVTLTGSSAGDANNPRQLSVNVSAGALNVSGNGVLYGVVRVPLGTVTIEGNGRVRGTVSSDRLVIGGNGVLQVTENDQPPPPVNRPPTVVAGPDQTITLPTDTVNLGGVADDDGLPSGSTLTVKWSKLSGPGAVQFGALGSASTTATFGEPGTYVLRLTAADTLLTSRDEVTVNVIARNQPPTVNAGADQTVMLPNGASLGGVVSDDALPVGSTVSVNWSKVSGPGNVTFASPNAATTAATFGAPGAYTLRLSADDTEFSVADEVVVNVNPENQPPTANAGPDLIVGLPDAASLNGSVSDDGWPSGGTLTASWSQVSGPGAVTFADANAPVTTATFGTHGTYVLRLTAGDTALSHNDEVTVTVDPPNHAPTVNAGADQAIELPNTAALVGSMSDDSLPRGASVTLAWSKVSGPGDVAFADAGALSTAATFGAPGTYTLRLTANDTALEASDTVLVTVHPENQPPTANAGADQTVKLPNTAALAGAVGDDGYPSGSTLSASWSQVSGPGAVTFADASSPATTAAFSVAGTYVLRLTASDTRASAFDEVTINVEPANLAPVVSAGADQTVSLPNVQVLFFDDFENGPGKWETPGSMILTTESAYSGSRSQTLARVWGGGDAFTPLMPVVPGRTYYLHVAYMSKGGGGQIQVQPYNSAKQMVRGAVAIGDGTYPFGSWDYNVFSRDTSERGVWKVYSQSFTATAETAYVKIWTEDWDIGMPNSPPNVFYDNVEFSNSPLPSYGQEFVPVVSLSGAVTDDGLPSSGALSSTWSKVSGPGAVTFADANSAVTSATVSEQGTYVLRLTATDSQLGAGDEVTVTVSGDNLPPTVDAGLDQTVKLSDAASLSGTVGDDGVPQGKPLAITWSKVRGPGAVTFSHPDATATTATFSEKGDYVLRLSASDSQITSSDTLTVRVDPGALYPSTDAGPDQTVTLPQGVSLNGSVTDPDGTVEHVEWWVYDGPGTVNFSNKYAAVTTATFTQPGRYLLGLSARSVEAVPINSINRYLYAVPSYVTITVNPPPPNQPPTVNAGADQSITLPAAATLSGTVTDDGQPFGSTVTVTWSKLSGPGTVTFAGPNALATSATFNAPGEYVLRLTASDTALQASDTVTVNVTGQVFPPVADFITQGDGGMVPLAFESTSAAINSDAPPQRLIDNSIATAWRTGSGQNTNQWVKFRTLNSQPLLISSVRLGAHFNNPNNSAMVKDFEVLVSETTLDDAAFRTVLGATWNNTLGKPQEFTFPGGPVRARYVKFLAKNNHNNYPWIEVATFDVFASGGGESIISLPGQTNAAYEQSPSLISNGAAIVDYSFAGPGSSQPNNFLAHRYNPWQTPNAPGQYVTIRLAGGREYTLDGVRLGTWYDFGYGGSTAVKDFDVWVSNTTADASAFTKVLTATAVFDGPLQTFMFPDGPVQARYVKYVPRTNRGGGATIHTLYFDVIARGLGGVVAVSGQNSAHLIAEAMLDGDPQTSFLSPQGATSNQWVKIALADQRVRRVYGMRIKAGGSNGPKDFQVQVSTTTADDAAFTTIHAGTLSSAATVQEVQFAQPADARYVQFRWLNHYGGSYLNITELEVLAYAEDGATVISSSSQIDANNGPLAALDIDNNTVNARYWVMNDQSTNQFVKLLLPGGAPATIDRVALRPAYKNSITSTAPKEFEIQVSTTTADDAAFTTAYAGTLSSADVMQYFSFPPAEARYVKLLLKNNYGGTGMALNTFYVFSPGLGSTNARFLDKSTDDRRVASWAWDFGDGATSTERDPLHTYAAPGTYNVTLTVADDDGLTSQRQMSYRAAEPLFADFTLTPYPLYEGGDYVFLYNRSSFRLGPFATRNVEWTPNNTYFFFRYEGSTGQDNTHNNFNDSGTYEIKLKIGTDGGVRYTASKTIQVLNYPPYVDINPGKTLVWGESWTSTPVTVADASSVDAASLRCNWDFKDGQTSEVLNCNRAKAAVTHTYNLPGVYDAALTVTDKDGGATTDVATFVVNKHPTGLALLETQNAGPGSPVLMRARLTDDYLGQPLGGKAVRFTVNGVSAQATTNADGTVEASVPLAPGAALSLAKIEFDEDGLYLSSGALVTGAPGPNVRPVGTRDSKGTDFWLMSPRNISGSGQLYLFISSETATTGTVSAPGVNFSTTFSVAANAVTRVTIPQNALSNTPDLVERKGIRVTAQSPVSVYGLNRQQFSTDAFLGLPTDALGTDYINLGYRNSSVIQGTEFGIVAPADATRVTITPSVKAGTRAAGVPFTITLNQGETFLLQDNATETGDLSGSHISSDKPVAVFGANECANIPTGYVYCDYLVEQLPPTTAWGRRFMTVPLATRQKGDTFRFVAAADATRVYVNGKQVAFLHRGRIHEQLIEGPAHIIADKPILVMQYSNGAGFDTVAGNNGDPFMVLVPPHERFLNRYTISTEMFGYQINYVNVVAPAAAVGQIKLDGAAIPAASFTPIGNSGFSGAQVAVGVGTHNLSGAQPFGATVYGYTLTDSYGYSAGFSLEVPVGDGRAVSLAPETSTQDQNTQGCVTATVTDEHQTLLVGERVEFSASGANSATASIETDAAGQAQFCYTGANRGHDLILAAVGQSASDTATKVWRSTAPNQAPSVNAGADQTVTLPVNSVTLGGTATDDGLPTEDPLTLSWSKQSGPGAVAFTNANSASTSATFAEAGAYVLRLTAGDSELTGFDELTVTVNPEPVNQPPAVSAGPDQRLAVKSNLVANAGNEAALVEGNITHWTEVAGETWTRATAGEEGFPAALSGQTYFYAGEAAEAELRQDIDLSAFAPGIAAGTQQFEFQTYVRSRAEATPDVARVLVEYRNAANTATVATLDSGPITSTDGWHLTEDTRPVPPGTGWVRIRLVASLKTGPTNDALFDGVSWRALGTAATKLQGSATDDGLPLGAALTSTWSKVSGPGEVTFSNASAPASSAVFGAPGVYVLRLSTTDTQLTASDEVAVTVEPANQTPSVNAGTDQTVTLPDGATLGGAATDDGYPSGSALQTSWSKVSGPGAVTFADANSPSTTATFSEPGAYRLRLSAHDSEYEAGDDVIVTVNPEPVNQPPAVNAGADQTITHPVNTATLSGTATDDGLPRGSTLAVNWTKLSGPGTAAFANANAASTAVTFSEPGTYVLRLSATDSLLSASDEVTVRFTPPNQPPAVNAGADQTITLPDTAAVGGTVNDDGVPAGATLTTTWSKVSGPGEVTFADPNQGATRATFGQEGVYVLRLTASDSELEGFDELTVTVNPSVPPPTVAINSPADGSEITGRTVFTGTVSEGSTWRLEYRLGGDVEDLSNGGWTTISSGNTPVTNGALGVFDPTVMLNGVYKVRLVATDAANQTSVITTSATVEGSQKIGNFSVSFKDLSVPVGGLSIDVLRTYDSRDKRVGDFGYGWTLGLRNVRIEKAGIIGKHWEQTVSGGFIPTYCLRPTRPTTVSVVLPNGKTYKFEARASKQSTFIADECQQVAPITAPGVWYRPMPGTKGKLESLEPNNVITVYDTLPGPVELRNNGDFQWYNPQLFRFTHEDGTVYVIHQRDGVKSITDPNGNTLTVTPDAVTHSDGQSVTFTRDAQGRVTRITDPEGKSLLYAYDANGDLVRFTDREGNAATYTYNATHHLLKVVDPLGNEPIFNQYDASGRLLGHTDANGNSIAYVHDLDGRVEKTTDRLGHTTRHEYDARGNVTRVVDAKGGVTTRTYDANDNLLTETDPLGHTTAFTYDDQDNVLTETDPLGRVTTYTYNSHGRPLTVTDPLGRVTTYTYDAFDNLLTFTDPLGHKTTHTYGWRGRHASATDALGNVTQFEYSLDGNLTRETDALGNAAEFEYNLNNRRKKQTRRRTTAGGVVELVVTTFFYGDGTKLLYTIHPDGTKTETAYDANGNPTASTDQQGRRTTYEYDDAGRLVKTTYPDGKKEESAYDAEGRQTRRIDRAGRATTYAYDELGRVVKTTYPDGAFTTLTYDAAGRVTAEADADGHTTRHEYDAAGRRTKTTDALGRATTFTFDAAGQPLTTTDAKGRKTTYVYDAAGRRTKVIFHDGTEQVTAYNAGNQVVSRTDQAGKTTLYEYDKVGRLLKVKDALGQTTAYAYDELGRRVSQTDANEHTTRYEYDKMGRQTKRTLPLGMSEVFAYDAGGQLRSRTDFNGKTTTYSHDSMGRLLSKTPDPSLSQPAAVFTYTAAGQRETMTDASGVTTYAYDARDRLQSKQSPAGTLTYAYDGLGNLKSLRSSNPNGVSADYAHDALHRLQTVTDNRPGAGATAYTYDAVGNLETVTYPNGLRSVYTYDDLNRLTNLAAGNSSATAASYAYTLGAAGNRLSVAERTGRTVGYAYDALYRLTGETVSGDPSAANNGSVGYTYDAVGNRLTRTSTLAAVAPQTHAYDANDRLTSDGYDANGNTASSQGTNYKFDFEDRMVEAGDGAVSFVYDGDGARVGKTAGGVTTLYLVDTNNHTGYAQVVEEVVGGEVQRTYTYGHDLISQSRLAGGDWALSFYGYDGHGSVRYLTDAQGAVTDTYDYDAFGLLVARTGTTPNDYLYAGERFDASVGLYYLRARYMNPASGRFWTMDTYEGAPSDPLSLHKYLYANADPANRVDPSGNFSIAETAIVNNIQATLANITSMQGQAIISQLLHGGNAGLESLAFDGGLLFLGPVIKLTGKALKSGGRATVNTVRRFLPVLQKYCFVAGTPVQTAVGAVPVEQIKVGDRVLTRNEQSGKLEYKEVTATFTREAKELLDVKVEGEEPIGVTPEHPFHARRAVPEDGAEAGGGWVEAGDLRVGDFVLRPSGEWAKVLEVKRRPGGGTVYNFEVAGNHNYFVGKHGVLVHNTCTIFTNKLAHLLARELDDAARLGVKPLKVGEAGFDDVANAGRVKWAVTEEGELFVIPHTVRGQEISHAVLTRGKPVVAAGEAEIATGGGRRMLFDITNHSGHFQPSAESLNIGKLAFANEGVELHGPASLLQP